MEKLKPGTIVLLKGSPEESLGSDVHLLRPEGLLLGYSKDGFARVLWYRDQHQSLHWSPEYIVAKENQDISVSGDNFLSFITRLQYLIYQGIVITDPNKI